MSIGPKAPSRFQVAGAATADRAGQDACWTDASLGVPVTEKTGRLGKWPGALGGLINLIKWTMGDVRSVFGAREPALFALGCSLKAKSRTKRTPRSAVNSSVCLFVCLFVLTTPGMPVVALLPPRRLS